MRRHIVLAAVASTVSAAAASAVTWYLTKKAFEEQYEERLRAEVETSINFLIQNNVDLEAVDVVKAVDDVPDATQEEAESTTLDEGFDVPPLKEVEGERIFSDANKPPLDELVRKRERVPYEKMMEKEGYTEKTPETLPEPVETDPNIVVISQDIFMSNISEYAQSSVTVFSDGGVLDEQGGFVEEHTELIGLPPYPFGEMSGEEGVVYIRNKKLEREFEVLYDEGKAAEFLAHDVQTKYSPED